ncbi:hypothetical protein BAUCODRAFT_118535 [Baudoinia panamericana UAMH 10762]|uniref:C2H2-type domain-containing protein n=1 Tax=Baudoinia panamericana (strain UAMH 10762) TaxID=717646 RepID=M2MV27_BAUPA|nr:uncharacterized protein BAUCODRAFT_118535 [Baudoinia panamericana UAMH 10762]EMD00807.1 hypothetical protein BAUCODRAFT_118535 [Baudoinia panamericana UAMH 10762]
MSVLSVPISNGNEETFISTNLDPERVQGPWQNNVLLDGLGSQWGGAGASCDSGLLYQPSFDVSSANSNASISPATVRATPIEPPTQSHRYSAEMAPLGRGRGEGPFDVDDRRRLPSDVPLPLTQSRSGRSRSTVRSSVPSRRDASTTGRGRIIACTVCGGSFRTSKDLERHAKKRFHRQYICPVQGCTKSYYRRDSFVRHKTAHKQLAMHECSYCARLGVEKHFIRKDHLSAHIWNVHAPPDLEIPSIDSMETIHGEDSPRFLWEAQSRCSSPFEFTIDDNDFMLHDGLLSGFTPPQIAIGAAQSSSATSKDCSACQKRAISELEKALAAIVGPVDTFVLTERLGLHHNTTTEKVARTLRKLLIEP